MKEPDSYNSIKETGNISLVYRISTMSVLKHHNDIDLQYMWASSCNLLYKSIFCVSLLHRLLYCSIV